MAALLDSKTSHKATGEENDTVTGSAHSAFRHGSIVVLALTACVACGGPSNGTAPDQSVGTGGSLGVGGAGSTKRTSTQDDDDATGGTTSTKAKTSSRGGSTAKSSNQPKGEGGSTSSQSASKGGSVAKGGSSGKVTTAASASGGTKPVTSATPPSTDPLSGDVTFSTPSQTFKDQIEVEMATTVDGAEIRYTTDNSRPTASSTVYSGSPLTIKTTTQVRAQAFVDGTASGAVSTAIYVARTIDPTSDIPILLVESYGKPKPCDKETYVEAAVMVWQPVDGVAKMASLPTLVTRAGYHVRGQSSMSFPQTPYKVELWDNANKDVDLPLLGMPADSDWALIAPFYDRTIIRNPFVYTLGQEMGMQAPRSEYAEVYINQTTHALASTEYEGIYWVTETIKNNKVRTNLKQLDDADTDLPKISGGYIFKFDQAAAEEPKILCSGSNPVAGFGSGNFGGGAPGGGTTTKAVEASTTTCTMTFGMGSRTSGTAGTCWTDLEVVDPDPLNEQQNAWLTDYIQQFHDSLHQSPIGDYASYIDLQSFIDYLLISELTRNVDAYVRSAYYFKDRDGKLKAGPLWDYNFALGGVGAQNPTPTTSSDLGWQYTGASRNVNNWYPKLTSDAAFMTEVKNRYTELRKSLWSDDALTKRMDTLSAPLKQAIVRDYERWPVQGVITSSTGFVGGPTTPTWEGQLQVMRDFVKARLAWMDSNLK